MKSISETVELIQVNIEKVSNVNQSVLMYERCDKPWREYQGCRQRSQRSGDIQSDIDGQYAAGRRSHGSHDTEHQWCGTDDQDDAEQIRSAKEC